MKKLIFYILLFMTVICFNIYNVSGARVDQSGRVNGISDGTCVITGNYIYNPNVIVNIYITVS